MKGGSPGEGDSPSDGRFAKKLRGKVGEVQGALRREIESRMSDGDQEEGVAAVKKSLTGATRTAGEKQLTQSIRRKMLNVRDAAPSTASAAWKATKNTKEAAWETTKKTGKAVWKTTRDAAKEKGVATAVTAATAATAAVIGTGGIAPVIGTGYLAHQLYKSLRSTITCEFKERKKDSESESESESEYGICFKVHVIYNEDPLKEYLFGTESTRAKNSNERDFYFLTKDKDSLKKILEKLFSRDEFNYEEYDKKNDPNLDSHVAGNYFRETVAAIFQNYLREHDIENFAKNWLDAGQQQSNENKVNAYYFADLKEKGVPKMQIFQVGTSTSGEHEAKSLAQLKEVVKLTLGDQEKTISEVQERMNMDYVGAELSGYVARVPIAKKRYFDKKFKQYKKKTETSKLIFMNDFYVLNDGKKYCIIYGNGEEDIYLFNWDEMSAPLFMALEDFAGDKIEPLELENPAEGEIDKPARKLCWIRKILELLYRLEQETGPTEGSFQTNYEKVIGIFKKYDADEIVSNGELISKRVVSPAANTICSPHRVELFFNEVLAASGRAGSDENPIFKSTAEQPSPPAARPAARPRWQRPLAQAFSPSEARAQQEEAQRIQFFR